MADKTTRRRKFGAAALLAVALLSPALCRAAPVGGAITNSVPWWDQFPGLIQTGDVALARRSGATGALCGAADDPTWGIFGQRQRLVGGGQATIRGLHGAGVKALTWLEGFGSAGSTYIVQIRRGPDGAWEKTPGDPTLTRIFHTHWDWQALDGTGEIRWVGAPAYFDAADFAAPWTRLHPRYGCPPMTYPDGRVATGYLGSPADPRTSRVFDAGCSKDVLGRVTFDYEYNPAVNRMDPATDSPHGPLTGLLATPDAPPGPPDPGYTPEQWARLKRPGYSGSFGPGKDSACPRWADYARASVRQALDAGVDGLWVDNFSPWDSFSATPIQKAFGDWSVAGFRGYLAAHFSSSALRDMGVSTPARFDVRQYLQDRCRAWGGDPANLSDPRWRDPRWMDDPLWRAYLIDKRQTGTAALSRFYHILKAEAARAGKPDFLVSGNDIPLFSLGWPRGDLDMVSTELSWGWGLTTGPRGLMPPPWGSYAPVYKLAREHARGRFVNAWLYVPDAQKGRPNIARVLYYQALANHAGPMPQIAGATAGDPATDAAFFGFLRRAAPVFGRRVPIEEVGLYHSSSSQLTEMLPGGFRDHANQPHSFSFWGWGTALTFLHVPWRAVPEWKLTPATLSRLKLLVVPSANVFPAEDVPVLGRWVRAGGALIVAGDCGRRLGEAGNFARCHTGTTLDRLTGSPAPAGHTIGRGYVLALPADPGLTFYVADKTRPALLPEFGRALAAVHLAPTARSLAAEDVPWSVGLTPYRDKGRVFVDVNNTDINLDQDVLTPAPSLRFTVALPPDLQGRRLRARVLSPDAAPTVVLQPLPGNRVQVTLSSISVFASVILD